MSWGLRILRGLGVCLVATMVGGGSLCLLVGRTYAQAEGGPAEADTLRAVSDSTAQCIPGRTAGRADLWKQKRCVKRREMQPRDPGFFDRVGDFFSRISGSVTPGRLILTVPRLGVAGVKPLVKDVDEAGLLYEPPALNKENRLVSVEATASLDRDFESEMLFGLESDRYLGYTYSRYRHDPDEQFYGLDPDSRPVDESAFRRDEGLFGGLVGRSVDSRMLVGGHVSYQLNRIGAGRGDLPSVRDRFGDSVPGVNRDVDYLMVGAFFEYDSRDAPYERAFGHRFAPTEERLRSVSVEATRGFYLAAEVTHNIDHRHHDFDFTRFTLDMREFYPVYHGLLHGFAFRQFASFTGPSDGQVPFYRMQSLGGPRSLRGYKEGRFRDRNVLLVNAELRCEIWHWLDMALFTDTGHVFRALDNVDVMDPRVGYGVGFRVKNNGQTLGRIDFARGEEGIRTIVDLGSLF